MARTVWSDYGARQETAGRTVWTDKGAYQETSPSGALRAYLFDNVNTFGTPNVIPPFGALKGTLVTSGLAVAGQALVGDVNVEVGDLVVVNTFESGATTTTTLIDDGLGNVYNSINPRIWYSVITAPGNLNVIFTTVTFSGNSFAYTAAVFKGPFTSSPLDANPTVVSDITSPFTGPATGTLAQAKELVIGICDLQRGQTTVPATSPFTLAINRTSAANTAASCSAAISYLLVNSTTSVAAEFTTATGTITTGLVSTHSFKADVAAATQTLTATLYIDPDTFGTAVVSVSGVTQTLTATRYVNPDTFGTTVVSRGPVTLTETRYVDPDTFGTAVIGRGAVTLTTARYVDPDTFRNPSIARGPVTLTSTRYVDPDIFGTAVVTAGAGNLVAVRYVDPDTFRTPVISRGPVTLPATRYVDPDTFGTTSRIRLGVTTTRYVDPDTFGTTSRVVAGLITTRYVDPDTFGTTTRISLRLTSNLYADPDTFRNPSVLRGTRTLTATRYVSPDDFGSPILGQQGGPTHLVGNIYVDPDVFRTPNIARGPVSLPANRYVDPDSFGTPAVLRGTYRLTPTQHVDPDVFRTAVVGRGPVTLTAARYVDPDSFGALVVGRGARNLAALRYIDPDVLRPPVLTQGLGHDYLLPTRFVNNNSFLSHQLRTFYTAHSTRYIDPDTFRQPALTGVYHLLTTRLVDIDQFYQTLVYTQRTLVAAKYDNQNLFYSIEVILGQVVLVPLLINYSTYGEPALTNRFAQHVDPAFYEDPDYFYTHIIRIPPTSGISAISGRYIVTNDPTRLLVSANTNENGNGNGARILRAPKALER